MKRITHGTLVRHADWIKPHYVVVATEWGIALEAGKDPEEAERLALARGGKLAMTEYDRKVPGGPGWERATVLVPGESVDIDGRRYAVKFNPGNTGAMPTTLVPITFLLESGRRGK